MPGRKPPRDIKEVLAEARASMGEICRVEPDCMVHKGPHSYMISAKEARAREEAHRNSIQALRAHFQSNKSELEQAQEKIRSLEAWIKKARGTGLLTLDPGCECRTCQDVRALLAEAPQS